MLAMPFFDGSEVAESFLGFSSGQNFMEMLGFHYYLNKPSARKMRDDSDRKAMLHNLAGPRGPLRSPPQASQRD